MSSANKYVKNVHFFQCRRQKNKPEDMERGNNKLKKQKVFVHVECEDGTTRQTKLKGCDIQKAKNVKRRCKPKKKPEKKEKEEKTKRDCDTLATPEKVANCKQNQG